MPVIDARFNTDNMHLQVHKYNTAERGGGGGGGGAK